MCTCRIKFVAIHLLSYSMSRETDHTLLVVTRQAAKKGRPYLADGDQTTDARHPMRCQEQALICIQLLTANQINHTLMCSHRTQSHMQFGRHLSSPSNLNQTNILPLSISMATRIHWMNRSSSAAFDSSNSNIITRHHRNTSSNMLLTTFIRACEKEASHSLQH